MVCWHVPPFWHGFGEHGLRGGGGVGGTVTTVPISHVRPAYPGGQVHWKDPCDSLKMHDPPFWQGFGIQASPNQKKLVHSLIFIKFKHLHIWQVSPWNPGRHWHVKLSKPCDWHVPPFMHGFGMQISPII